MRMPFSGANGGARSPTQHAGDRRRCAKGDLLTHLRRHVLIGLIVALLRCRSSGEAAGPAGDGDEGAEPDQLPVQTLSARSHSGKMAKASRQKVRGEAPTESARWRPVRRHGLDQHVAALLRAHEQYAFLHTHGRGEFVVAHS